MTVDEPDTAAEARAIHARREIQALEWGFAFLDAFDLGPAALDVVDGAIARLDAMDGDTDIEDGHDAEDDTADLGDDETGNDLLDLGEFDEAKREPIWNNAYTTDVPAVGCFNG